MEDIIIIGFGGHAKSVADSIATGHEYNIVGYTDVKKQVCNYPYIGTDDALSDCFRRGIKKAVLGVGFLGGQSVRDALVNHAKEIGFEFPTIIDPSAIIASDVSIFEGTFIGKNVVINSGARVGKYCIINSGSIVEHECVVNDFSHISVGAILCGEVSVGDHTMIGAGTTVIQCKQIGNNCIIGANSTILSNISDNVKIYGVV